MHGAAPAVRVLRHIGCRGRGVGGRFAAALRLVLHWDVGRNIAAVDERVDRAVYQGRRGSLGGALEAIAMVRQTNDRVEDVFRIGSRFALAVDRGSRIDGS